MENTKDEFFEGSYNSSNKTFQSIAGTSKPKNGNNIIDKSGPENLSEVKSKDDNSLKKYKPREFKYKKLSQDMQDFYKLLDDYQMENLLNKLNDKLKSNLSISTYNEIIELEKKMDNQII